MVWIECMSLYLCQKWHKKNKHASEKNKFSQVFGRLSNQELLSSLVVVAWRKVFSQPPCASVSGQESSKTCVKG